jgi:hypothetical protein
MLYVFYLDIAKVDLVQGFPHDATTYKCCNMPKSVAIDKIATQKFGWEALPLMS